MYMRIHAYTDTDTHTEKTHTHTHKQIQTHMEADTEKTNTGARKSLGCMRLKSGNVKWCKKLEQDSLCFASTLLLKVTKKIQSSQNESEHKS